MKKVIPLLLVIIIGLSLAACGGTGNPDHDYVLALMEKGDYAMAIQVLEHLQEQSGGVVPAATQNVPDETTAVTEPPAQTLPVAVSGQAQIVIDLVNRFMEEKGNELIAEYEKVTATRADDFSVTHALEYRLGNWEGFPVHFMLVSLDIDVCYTDPQGVPLGNDNVQVLLDLDSGICYDSTMLPSSTPETASTIEEVHMQATNSYSSYIMGYNDSIWSDAEFREPLTDSDIAAINEALK